MKVLLLHGQGRTTHAMRLLGSRLRRLGHPVQYFRYYTRREKFTEIVDRLVETIKESPHDQPYVLIGHSMGGLLSRASLPALKKCSPRHLVLLASPSQPPRLAPRLQHSRIYRYFTTDCGQQAANAEFYQVLAKPSVPTTIIAGTGGPRARWLPYGYEPNDGAMSVRETLLGPEYEVLLVPSIHTFIMNSLQTLHHIDRILRKLAN